VTAQGLALMLLAAAPASAAFALLPADGAVAYEAARLTIAARLGEPVRAPAAGRVTRSAESPVAFLEIDHGGGLVARYAHLASPQVKIGDRVAAGQVIARVGHGGEISGPHIHVQLTKDGRPADLRTYFPPNLRAAGR